MADNTTINLDEAIAAMERALVITPNDPNLLHKLGSDLLHRFDTTGVEADLDRAIKLMEKSEGIMPPDLPERPALLLCFGKGLATRYNLGGEEKDVNKAISVWKEGLRMTTPGHHSRIELMDALLLWIGKRFEDREVSDDLEECINLASGLLTDGPSDHPDRVDWLERYGNHLSERFELRGKISDIDLAIQTLSKALRAVSQTDADISRVLANLATSYGRRFDKTGDIGDINQAIDKLEEALTRTSGGSLRRPRLHGLLSQAYSARYAQFFALENLDEAIRHSEEVVDSTHLNDPRRPLRLNNLAHCYGMKFQRLGVNEDLTKAIDSLTKVLATKPPTSISHMDRAICLGSLAHKLAERSKADFHDSDEQDDLNRAIACLEEALKLIPVNHPRCLYATNDLARCLRERFERFGKRDMADLDRSIELLKTAVSTLEAWNQFRAQPFLNLGRAYEARYNNASGSNPEDQKHAVHFYSECWHSENSPPSTRLKGGRGAVVHLASLQQWKRATVMLREIFDLFPSLSPRSLSYSDQQYVIRQVAGLASMATAVALNSGTNSFDALTFLELGRGIMTTFMMETRMDLTTGVTMLDSELASNFLEARARFESLRTLNSRSPNEERLHLASGFRRRDEAEEKLRDTIKNIQAHPSMKSFLGPPTLEELMQAARNDTIVVINAEHYRSDAFLVDRIHGVRIVELNNLKVIDIEKWVERLRSSRPYIDTAMLEWLWDALASPVLEELDFCYPPAQEGLPRVWWILTGAMVHLPIHAAGLHTDRSKTVIDRVMSSYSSSLREFVYLRSRNAQHSDLSHGKKALLVGMGSTPGFSDLPFADEEVNRLEKLCLSLGLIPIRLKEPQRSAILAELSQCTIFHFAGHGRSHPQDPSASHLMLADGPLSIADLRDQNFHNQTPFLAYLSACLTGANESDLLVDEAIHIIGACQLAGFRHVIGTLWQVSDKLCVEAAEMVYKGIAEGGMTDDSICSGLHKAVVCLRDTWVKQQATSPQEIANGAVLKRVAEAGERVPALFLDKSNRTSSRTVKADWIVYVHYGP